MVRSGRLGHMVRTLLAVVWLGWVGVAAADPFKVGERPVREGVVAAGDAVGGNPMASVLDGVVGSLDAADIGFLRRGLGEPLTEDALAGAERVALIHLGKDGSDGRVEVLRLASGGMGVRTVGGDAAWAMDPAALQRPGWAWWRAGWRPEAGKGAERLRLEGTGDSSDRVLDRATIRRVIRETYPPTGRDLKVETIHVRLPKGHDPSRAAGVLVWVSPTPDGRLPSLLEPMVDELRLIAVGADNAGNERMLTDRLQLMLDALESARRRYLVDEERVYVTGLSGGGRCSGILLCSMPDVFAGAVPVIGLDDYHDPLTGQGKQFWPRRIGKPPPPVLRLLKQRRLYAITGDMDVNQAEMSARVGLLVEDGVTARIDVVEGMGHTMPDPERWASALEWVDEPRRAALAEGVAKAERLLAAVPEGPVTDPEVREALREVMAAAPWSAPAWVAAERLGYRRDALVKGTAAP